jgi:hypothetical protein
MLCLTALYRVIKTSLCTWRLQYNYQVHRLFDQPVYVYILYYILVHLL